MRDAHRDDARADRGLTLMVDDPARRNDRLVAVAFASLMIVVTAACAPFLKHVYGVVPSFLQGYAIVLGASEVLTAFLLLWRARSSANGRLAQLAAAYAFSAPLILANVLTLPGVIDLPPGFPAGMAPWARVFWHVGWGVGVALYFAAPVARTRRPARPWLIGLALACAAIGVAFASGRLPRLLEPSGAFTPALFTLYALALLIYASTFARLFVGWRRLSVLDLWVGVAVVALALDIALTMIAATRFSLGFYIARCLNVVSGSIVLIAFFGDVARLVRRADTVDQYAVVVANLPHIALIVDGERRCLFVNPAWTRVTGQPANDALGRGYLACMHPEDERRALASASDGIAEGSIRLRVAGAGGYRRYLMQTAPLQTTAAAEAGWVITAFDVEERAQAEAALRTSDDRLRTFLDTVPQIVWTANATGWIDWYNPRWYEFTGQTPAEAAGWGWQAAHHPEDLPTVMERWPESIATGATFEMEFRLRRFDGVYHWFLTRIVPHFDETGMLVRWYGSNTDIDAQKRGAQRSARIAQVMQEAFLPDRLPERAGLRFDALYLPAESDALVGGDWYDAFTIPDGRIVISCGDVVGHGLDAAVSAGRFRQSIALAALEDPNPASIMRRVNEIALLQGESVTTAVVALLDPVARDVAYALAGHPPPVVATGTCAARFLTTGGLPLGVLRETAWETVRVDLDDASLVVFYTDGVTEISYDLIAAEGRLLAAATSLHAHPGEPRPARAIKDLVIGSAAPRDDVAILVVRLAPEAVLATVTNQHVDLTRKWRFHSSDSQTAHNARRALAEFLGSIAADPATLYEAELIVGEALANTVEHAPGIVEVTIDWHAERPILVVRDTGPGFTPGAATLPADTLSEDGRGMFLIHALAGDVTIRRSVGFGMELRCTLPLTRRSSPVTVELTAEAT